jgi:hypothetical protein
MNYAPSGQLDSATSVSLLLFARITAVAWMAFAACLAWIAARRARLLVGAPANPKTLRSGPARLMGVVELARGEEGAPIEVTVCRGSTREASARPFYLRLEGGRRIRVETADSAIDLAARFSPPIQPSIGGEVRNMTIEAGARVFIVGELSDGVDPEAIAMGPGIPYREPGATTLVLRARRRVLRLTPSDLRTGLRRFPSIYLASIAGAALWLGALQVGTRDFRALQQHGTVVAATVVRPYTILGGHRTTCSVDVEVDHRLLSDQITCVLVRELPRGTSIPWTLAPPWWHVGAHEEGLRQDGVNLGAAGFLALCIATFGFALTDERRRRIRVTP